LIHRSARLFPNFEKNREADNHRKTMNVHISRKWFELLILKGVPVRMERPNF